MNKILIVSTTGMGDSLWATPAIRALKQSFPEVQLDFLVDARWKPLFHGNPHIHRIHEYRKTWLYQLGIRFKLLLTDYDHALAFHANRDIRRILSGVRSPTLFHQPFPWLSENQLVAIDGPVHGIQRRLTLIEKLGAKSAGSQMELFFNDQDRAVGGKFLEKNRLSPKNFIYINVGASLPHKRWSPDRFIGLAQKILETTAYKIVLGGGPGETALVESVEARLNSDRVTHAHDRPIRDNAFLIGQARMMVTCDSGPMHIGFALKIPTIALFGVSDPRQSGPFELEEKLCCTILSPVNPYFHPEGVDNPDCFDQISLSTVWEKVQETLTIS